MLSVFFTLIYFGALKIVSSPLPLRQEKDAAMEAFRKYRASVKIPTSKSEYLPAKLIGSMDGLAQDSLASNAAKKEEAAKREELQRLEKAAQETGADFGCMGRIPLPRFPTGFKVPEEMEALRIAHEQEEKAKHKAKKSVLNAMPAEFIGGSYFDDDRYTM